jgi:hypothetical protein
VQASVQESDEASLTGELGSESGVASPFVPTKVESPGASSTGVESAVALDDVESAAPSFAAPSPAASAAVVASLASVGSKGTTGPMSSNALQPAAAIAESAKINRDERDKLSNKKASPRRVAEAAAR